MKTKELDTILAEILKRKNDPFVAEASAVDFTYGFPEVIHNQTPSIHQNVFFRREVAVVRSPGNMSLLHDIGHRYVRKLL